MNNTFCPDPTPKYANMSSVIKRNGTIDVYDESKILSYLEQIADGLIYINPADIFNSAKLSFYDKIPTTLILEILISECVNRITVDAPDYQIAAARLQINVLRRKVWHSWLPMTSFYQRIVDRINRNIYDPTILTYYTQSDIDYIENNILRYENDLLLTYSGVRQFLDKYLIKDRVTNDVYETPQEANILICMYMFMKYDNTNSDVYNGISKRTYYISLMYTKLSTFIISLPTPIYAGVRSTIKSFSSCCVIDCGDTTRSILSTSYIIGNCITKRYGIGVNIGKIRGLGASINNGNVIHTGVVPFLKIFEATTKGFIQNGIRGGGGTISFPFWHWEVLTLLELKNNKGVVENRVRSLDYSIGLNKYFIAKAIQNESIYLFSAEDVPLLSNDYTYDYNNFVRVYESYVNNSSIRKTAVNGQEMLMKIVKERYETGRIYVYFMDNMNNYGVFTESIFSSNLCQEIALPTRPCELITSDGNGNDDDDGLVAVCILSCINVGRLIDTNNFSDLEETCDVIVRFLNEMIDYQVYDFHQLKRSAVEYRPLGIGISDLFHLLAMKGFAYDTFECRNYVHRLCEHFQYYLIKASCNLASENGRPCVAWNKSKYSQNIFPMDRYKASVDALISDKVEIDTNGIYNVNGNDVASGRVNVNNTTPNGIRYYCDWDTLRSDVRKYGMYNTCLSAIPPTATSSSISNSTPGIDPPRSAMVTKVSKYGAIKQVIPDYDVYRDVYTLSANVSNNDYFKLIGVIQKWIDQGISTNSYYMRTSDVGYNDVIQEIVNAYKYGLKSLYYLNSNKGVDEDIKRAFSSDGIYRDSSRNNVRNNNGDNGCTGGACSV